MALKSSNDVSNLVGLFVSFTLYVLAVSHSSRSTENAAKTNGPVVTGAKANGKMADLPKELVTARRKDFVKQNILCVKRSSPKELKQRTVDTRHGDTRDLKYSGLLPIYVHKKVRPPFFAV